MKNKKMSQEKLANLIGISRPALTYKLSGRREFLLCEALAIRDAFGLSSNTDLSWLFQKEE